MVSQKKILVIDDSEPIGRLLAGYFERVGFSAMSASGFQGAEILLTRQDFDLVVIDLNLDEGKTSIELLPLIPQSAKILLVSNQSIIDIETVARRHKRIDDYAPKAEREEIVFKVKRLLAIE